ncbi:Mevalonate kinase [Sesamum alatum]|uniref:Mevalonate kinase n=1 Tax=Sesamum alatum TaxID=300844 RepID=A0AAE2CJP6_9LAMI|nr:Mevalonate kinase [Sesamum alatum]
MEVRARAPGKIILAGEHAVVHGSTAVAAAIDLYTYVSLRFPTPTDNDNQLKLHLKDVGLELSWPVGKLKEALPKLSSHPASAPSSCSLETFKAITALVDEQNIPETNIGLATGVSAFLWLYTSIHGDKPAKVVVTSELPLGSGLGSSAAFCVALSGALLALSESGKLDFTDQGWQIFQDSDLELVNKWAFEGEKIIHGKPSGIDNTVSTYGNMIKFRSGQLTRIKTNMPLKMLITNTKVGRNTKALVASVSERTLRHTSAMASVFNAVDAISNELAAIIQAPASDDLAVTEKEEKLGELMEMNQGLLLCMGVSHLSIDTVIRVALKYKLSTKLTGAGGGGCVLTLLPTLLSGTVVNKVIAELESCGFQCMIAGIGGGGMEKQKCNGTGLFGGLRLGVGLGGLGIPGGGRETSACWEQDIIGFWVQGRERGRA